MAYDVTEERLKVKGSESITRDLQVTGTTYANNSVVGNDLEVTNSISMGRCSGSTVGTASVAEGRNVIASGVNSHAEGFMSKACGPYSHAEGQSTIANNIGSHAEGIETKACYNGSHAEGECSRASCRSAHAEGFSTCADADGAHSEGWCTQASSCGSHAEGIGTIAPSCQASHVQGKYNVWDFYNDRTLVDVIGYGSGANNRANIEATDHCGNKFLKGDVYIHANKDSSGGTAIGTTLANKIDVSEKGVANGVATLDATGRVPYSQLPESAMEYKGTWDASTNTPTLADGTGTNGDFYVVSVAGTVNLGTVANPRNVTFYVNDRIIYDGATSQWARLPAAEVRTINGQTGDVVLTANDIDYDSNTTVKTQIDNAEANAKCLDNATGVLDITHGGTGATCAADARACLGLGDISTINTNNCTIEFLRGDGTWAPPSSVASCADCGKNGSNYCAFGTNAFNSTAFTTCTGTVTVSNVFSSTSYPIALCTGATAIGKSNSHMICYNPGAGVLCVCGCICAQNDICSYCLLADCDAVVGGTVFANTSVSTKNIYNVACIETSSPSVMIGTCSLRIRSWTRVNTSFICADYAFAGQTFCGPYFKFDSTGLHLKSGASICYDL